ncbi:PREDICTED: galactosylgalactosylxylosylprotein 3-beta-glucuronosyltransferase 2 [Mandrillus leucophaeus]|uniref:galactosylgalactosylxylosylprotein 3-beta-glucuronosyltransferase 2 n=1 Tax=Mandrillus leucophaeus TaxID=9568 RepID=UPI0005F376F0|nr:PREDICTED: galactosylgalactosylxylosylprotein 3-beta-glucuronosyltransferase 2 [Mandrillus leucophaeus]
MTNSVVGCGKRRTLAEKLNKQHLSFQKKMPFVTLRFARHLVPCECRLPRRILGLCIYEFFHKVALMSVSSPPPAALLAREYTRRALLSPISGQGTVPDGQYVLPTVGFKYRKAFKEIDPEEKWGNVDSLTGRCLKQLHPRCHHIHVSLGLNISSGYTKVQSQCKHLLYHVVFVSGFVLTFLQKAAGSGTGDWPSLASGEDSGCGVLTAPPLPPGFAVSLQVILSNPKAVFKRRGSQPGMQESDFLKQITTVEELEPKANNCTKVLVWHTRTEKVNLANEPKYRLDTVKIEV